MAPFANVRSRPRWGSRIAAGLLPGLLVSCGPPPPLTIYAPASLVDLMEEVASHYEDATEVRVAVRGGASGILAREIEAGAPADVLLLADPAWAQDLKERGTLVDGTLQVLAWNRLAVVVPMDVSILPQSTSFLPTFSRLAIGDPELAPVGAYAKQALETLGYWNAVQDRLVLAPDARAALALAERGEVDAAIVYASDARHSDRVRFGFEIPEQTHEPIVYVVAIPKDAPNPDAARRFLTYLSGPEGRALFREWGLEGP